MMNRAPFVIFAFFVLGAGAIGAEVDAPVAATPPGETAASFRTVDGFSMEVLAAEPLVTDPVAICYDADGRAYVAEMNDYPYTDKAKHVPMQENPTDEAIGKIRLLTDDDGDGVFDRASVFAEGLSWPTGVAPWKGGIFVTAAPDFWYFKDTDGDGVADVKEKITTGYRKYNVQSEVNTPVWGLDNRIYIATGRNKGALRAAGADAGSAVAMPGGRDVRIDPRSPGEFEFVSGGVQFGNAFDDWGNRFLCSAGGSVHHVVMPAAAIDRNPWLPSRSVVRGCIDRNDPVKLYPVTPIEGWRLQRYEDRKFVPRPGYTESRGVNPGDPSRPTSSCGAVVYRGDAYAAQHRGSYFVAESCYSLVYRLEGERAGATFSMRKPRGDGAADVIASEDVWFRPIAMVNAPDGCLHLADLYRPDIEHPWSLPEEFHARMDLLRGRDRGRIYRIAPEGYVHRPAPKLSEAGSAELVELLGHANAWHRETAQRLLFERQDKSVAAALGAMAVSDGRELARLHALWTLDGLDALRPGVLTPALSDASAGVRANAVRIAARLLPRHPVLLEAVAALAEDADAVVRFEVALALGDESDPRVAGALAKIAKKDGADSWARLAVLSSAVPHAAAMLVELAGDGDFAASASAGEMFGALARIVGARGKAGEIEGLIRQLAAWDEGANNHRLTTATGLADGLRAAKLNLAAVAKKAGGAVFFNELIGGARKLAGDAGAGVARRSNAIGLLRYAEFEEVGGDLVKLLDPKTPEAIQSAVARTLASVGSGRPETGGLLLAGWDGYSGELRNQVLELLLSREERLDALLDAIESGKIQAYQLGPTRRDMLVGHKNAAIAGRAGKLFAGAGSREEVLEKYRESLALRGNPSAGESVYDTVCMACHKFREKGIIDLAPNLAVVSDWEAERILANIIDPNREVAPEYMEYIVETKAGDTLTGRVAAETASGITVRLADNSTRDIARGDILKLINSGRSLMPDGLEAAITPQQMADLIAYLTQK